MTTPNVYLPYPCPQNTTELLDDINARVGQSCVPTSLLNLVMAIEQSPEVQADINQIEANMDSTANE
jgi:hypothetical protein